jgi:hypothetical protein
MVVSGTVVSGTVVSGTVVSGTVVSGTVVSGVVVSGTVVTGVIVSGTVVTGTVVSGDFVGSIRTDDVSGAEVSPPPVGNSLKPNIAMTPIRHTNKSTIKKRVTCAAALFFLFLISTSPFQILIRN